MSHNPWPQIDCLHIGEPGAGLQRVEEDWPRLVLADPNERILLFGQHEGKGRADVGAMQASGQLTPSATDFSSSLEPRDERETKDTTRVFGLWWPRLWHPG